MLVLLNINNQRDKEKGSTCRNLNTQAGKRQGKRIEQNEITKQTRE